eukprot:364910-Chlamydomonas_euryale.AAC.8
MILSSRGLVAAPNALSSVLLTPCQALHYQSLGVLPEAEVAPAPGDVSGAPAMVTAAHKLLAELDGAAGDGSGGGGDASGSGNGGGGGSGGGNGGTGDGCSGCGSYSWMPAAAMYALVCLVASEQLWRSGSCKEAARVLDAADAALRDACAALALLLPAQEEQQQQRQRQQQQQPRQQGLPDAGTGVDSSAGTGANDVDMTDAEPVSDQAGAARSVTASARIPGDAELDPVSQWEARPLRLLQLSVEWQRAQVALLAADFDCARGHVLAAMAQVWGRVWGRDCVRASSGGGAGEDRGWHGYARQFGVDRRGVDAPGVEMWGADIGGLCRVRAAAQQPAVPNFHTFCRHTIVALCNESGGARCSGVRRCTHARGSPAAWCAVARLSGSPAAWCAVARLSGSPAAWCAVARLSGSPAAWCAVARLSESPAAWCAVARLSGSPAA